MGIFEDAEDLLELLTFEADEIEEELISAR